MLAAAAGIAVLPFVAEPLPVGRRRRLRGRLRGRLHGLVLGGHAALRLPGHAARDGLALGRPPRGATIERGRHGRGPHVRGLDLGSHRRHVPARRRADPGDRLAPHDARGRRPPGAGRVARARPALLLAPGAIGAVALVPPASQARRGVMYEGESAYQFIQVRELPGRTRAAPERGVGRPLHLPPAGADRRHWDVSCSPAPARPAAGGLASWGTPAARSRARTARVAATVDVGRARPAGDRGRAALLRARRQPARLRCTPPTPGSTWSHDARFDESSSTPTASPTSRST